jgi:hypothetical protein
MTMDEIEARLKRLSLRQPSAALDHRVLSQAPQMSPVESPRPRWAVPLWAAAAASMAIGGIGFMAGMAVRTDRPGAVAEEPPPVTTDVLCQSPEGRNPFDLTQFADPLLPGKPVVSVQISKGT